MKELNLPPFYIGEEVVAIADKPWFKKGDKFIIKDLFRCRNCGTWKVDIGRTEVFAIIQCNSCNQLTHKTGTIDWYSSTYFAPITSTFQSISLTKVLETEMPLICVN